MRCIKQAGHDDTVGYGQRNYDEMPATPTDGIARASLAVLADTVRLRTFAAGQDLLSAGDEPDTVFRIVDGRAKAWRQGQGGQMLVLIFYGPGDFPGLISVSRRTAAPAAVTAVTDVRVEAWPAETWYALLASDTRLADNTLRYVTRGLDQAVDMFEDAASLPVEQRLARALLRTATEIGETEPDGALRVPVTRQDLADVTGITLYTVSRLMSRWTGEGLIRPTRGRVILRGLDGITRVACPTDA